MAHRLRVFRNFVIVALALVTISSSLTFVPNAAASGTITGNVFRDFNANGIDDGANEIGVVGVTVTAYDAAGAAQGNATTDANGDYTLNASGTGPYRVEFTNLPEGYFPSAWGSDSGTTVQFVPDGNSPDVNLGINHPEDYVDPNPSLASPRYFNGLPNASNPAMFSWPYTNSGTAPAPTTIANSAELGSVWGLAYDRQNDQLYSAAFVKRHVGLYESPTGTPHPGMIFITTDAKATGGTSTPFFDLSTVPTLDLGTVVGNVTRGLSTAATPSNDATVFTQVGTVGLGGMTISSDGSMLWVVSLNDKQLVGIPTDSPTAAAVVHYPIPDPGCTGGESRPFAAKYYRDLIYIGTVCDASISQSQADLEAYIYPFDPANPSASSSPIINFPLDYPRLNPAGATGECNTRQGWFPWATAWPGACPGIADKLVYPQPILSDIEFDIDGSLIIGFMDRLAHQAGYNNYPLTGTTLIESMSSGDVLRAYNNNGTYELEDNGIAGSLIGQNGIGEGPGGHEFYDDDWGQYYMTINLHPETSLGGLAFLIGSNEIALTAHDPISASGNERTNGVIFLSNTNGDKIDAYRVIAQVNSIEQGFGKSGGMGDLELLLDAAPIEVGNRVWQDTNSNGRQDPGEAPIAGVTVTLHNSSGTQIASAVTDSDGLYSFSSASGTNTPSAIYNITGLTPDSGFQIRVATGQAVLSGLTLTTQNVGTDANADVRDSDALLNGANAVIAFTTGVAGANNHDYDIGFTTTPQTCVVASNDLGGVVFQDLNANGTKDTAEPAFSPLLGTVTVNAYDEDNNLVATTTLRSDGSYLFPGIFATHSAIRLEFVDIPEPFRPSAHGSTAGSSVTVQRHTGPACAANLAVNIPVEYCQNNPDLCTSLYVNGDTNTTVPTATMLRFAYNNSGTLPAPTTIADKADVGSTWGLAYDRYSGTLYSAAFIRRHVGLGPDGLGAIYQISNVASATPGAPSLFFDVTSVPGIDVGTIADNTTRGLGAPTTPNNDPDAFDAVGKIGLGDLDISDDGSTLYTVNLNERTLLKIPTTSPSAANVDVYPIPTNACVGGEARPFATKYYRGKVYVGVVCDGTSSSRSNLEATVYAFDPTAATFTEVFQMPLTYTLGQATGGCTSPDIATHWNPWTDTMGSETSCIVGHLVYPQPMLTDIEFDVDGSMLLGFADRWGYQLGNNNYAPTTNTFISAAASGDLIRVNAEHGGFVLESNGVAGSHVSATGSGNGQGPGGGEFYVEGAAAGLHYETSQGGLALHMGNGEVATTAMDPNDIVYSGGARYYNNSNGSIDHSYTLYTTGSTAQFGKANGLGDLELLCDTAPLEIGNYVWLDADKDGIQDPSEAPISGVTVELYDSVGNQIATTTTAANGEYYFNDANVPGGLLPNTDYSIRIDLSQVPLANYVPTVLDYNGDAGNSDLNDSDGDTTLNAGYVTAPVTTGAPGENNHTYDFGFHTVPFSLGNRVWFDTNDDGQISAGESGIDGVSVSLFLDANADGTPDTPATPLATTVTADGGYYRFDNLDAGTYVVRINPSNFDSSVSGALVGYNNSTSTEAMPNSDGDTNDNGINVANPPSTGILSGPVTLGPGGSEPTGETELSPSGQGTTDDHANMTVDFGFYRLTMGNQLWVDVNDNGQIDAGESGSALANVRVELYDGAILVAVTYTDANGNYLFDQQTGTLDSPTGEGLPPSTDYTVHIPASEFAPGKPLEGFASSTGATSSSDSFDNGVDDPDPATNGISSAVFSLQPGNVTGGATVDGATGTTTNPTLDFGFTSYSLGNLVWNDGNNNGVVDVGESGISGVTVQLYQDSNDDGVPDGPPIATTVTNATGHYLFTGLTADTYLVELTPPLGYVSSTGANGSASGPYEAAPDPENDSDHDDNGTTTGGSIWSAPVTLTPGGEPTGEDASTGLTDLAPDANSNLTVDFGLFRPLRLGNLVWEDTNNNGVVDGGESGIAGVTVALYTSSQTPGVDPPLATTTTDASGLYQFTHLIPGDYVVVIPATEFAAGGALADYVSSTGTNGSASGPYEAAPDPDNDVEDDDNGSTAASGFVASAPVTLTLSGEPDTAVDGDGTDGNQTVDFGFFSPARLGDYVWDDTDLDGVQDPGESGVPNVTVTLYNAADNSVVATTTTDASGSYGFDTLIPGDYYVIFSTLPATYAFVPADQGGDDTRDSDADPLTGRSPDVTLAAGDHNPTIDAGIATANVLRLGNLVWADYNDNGLVDSGEPGISGVTVELYTSGQTPGVDPPLATTTTDATGHYLFTNLAPGDYLVAIPATAFAAGGPLENWSSSVGGGSSEPAPDPDNNTDNDDNGSTAASGSVASLPVTLTLAGEPDTGVDGDNTNGNRTVDFGFVPQLASIGDTVWYDTNRNNLQDAGEVGVPNVTVRLQDSSGTVLATTTTDATGTYLFTNLVPGDYRIVFDLSSLPADYRLVGQDVGGDDTVDSDANPLTGATILTTLTAGENDLSWDAGVYQLASIGDTVWDDTDGDGVQDAGEPGHAGVTVQLWDGSGALLASTTTDATGHYQFSDLEPGDYAIVVLPPAGYGFTTQDSPSGTDTTDSDVAPSTGRTSTTTLSPGEQDPSWDAGLVGVMRLGNLVWNDLNNNGVVDAGESGISGVTVRLYADSNQDGVPDGVALASTVTDASGQYLFTGLVPGHYLVELVPPSGFVSSSGTNGSASGPFEAAPDPDTDVDHDDNGTTVGAVIRSGPVTLVGGAEPITDGDTDANSNLTVDFGLYQPASLGDTVWHDRDGDGIQDVGEPGVPGVTVTLYDSHGTVVATTVTDASGQYQFGTLAPGDYTLGFTTLPADLPAFTTPQQGGDPARDSDVAPETGRTSSIRLTPGEHTATMDAGVVEERSDPTAVTLRRFTVTWDGQRQVVAWTTTLEVETAGFHLWRSTTGRWADAERVTTQLIRGQGRGTAGANYTWTDPDVTVATVGRYTYWLEEQETGGGRLIYGPATDAGGAGLTTRILLPWVTR